MAILDIPTLNECGCKAKVYQDGSGVDIEYCDLHQAAPGMLKALESIINEIENATSINHFVYGPGRRVLEDAAAVLERAKGA